MRDWGINHLKLNFLLFGSVKVNWISDIDELDHDSLSLKDRVIDELNLYVLGTMNLVSLDLILILSDTENYILNLISVSQTLQILQTHLIPNSE
jgi:hypothetical protein